MPTQPEYQELIKHARAELIRHVNVVNRLEEELIHERARIRELLHLFTRAEAGFRPILPQPKKGKRR